MSAFHPPAEGPRDPGPRRRDRARGARTQAGGRSLRSGRAHGWSERWSEPRGGGRGVRRLPRRAGGGCLPAVAGKATAAGGLLVTFLAGVAADVPGLVLGSLLAAVGWPVASATRRRRAAARRRAVRSAAAPAVLDLLGAALLAGLNPHLAVLRVAERAPDALRQELGLAAGVLRLGGSPAAALHAAAERTGLDELRAAAGALEAAERWGAPPAEALAARAEALRSRARLHAEAEAGRAAVRLAFPLVLCFLPAFVLLTVVPTIASSLRALAP
jgi:Flp pilus assembly protein TadB